jgi:hypothetical protein
MMWMHGLSQCLSVCVGRAIGRTGGGLGRGGRVQHAQLHCNDGKISVQLLSARIKHFAGRRGELRDCREIGV